MSRWSGYIPVVLVGGGAGACWFIAAGLGIPVWILTPPAAIGGYFASRALLRRVYSAQR